MRKVKLDKDVCRALAEEHDVTVEDVEDAVRRCEGRYVRAFFNERDGMVGLYRLDIEPKRGAAFSVCVPSAFFEEDAE